MKRIMLAIAIATMTACGQPVDVTKAVKVDVVTSGWVTDGVVNGKNKIVPAVALTLKNVSGDTLSALQVNTVFRLVTTNDEIGTAFRPVAGSGGTPAGAATEKMVLKSERGYTGEDPFDDLLKNSKFVDAKVEVFVKAGAGQWTRMGEYPIAREYTGG
jgi:hypothetical protein